ncbi:MAG: phosphate acetyltransferase [Planctomycetes bacterium RBG_13_63_9]|nr:MAG: phosphate acetyltransferase [Planctomycetes bacterium RBG_13_63_9]
MIRQLIERVHGRSLSAVLPEGKDARIVAAARRLKDEGIAQPIVLGTFNEIEAAADNAGVPLDGISIITPAESDRLEAYAAAYARNRGLEVKIGRRIVKRPLYFGCMMVAEGDANTMVAGVTHTTASVISAGVLTVGLAKGVEIPSSFFLMIIPEFEGRKNHVLMYADCGVTIAPTSAQLADIALASERSARELLSETPRVAMLSFSTKGSASHDHVDRVTEALKIAKDKASHVMIDGEFQADAAIVPAVAAKKIKEPSSVAGRANVLIFPDLNSGNIAYKLTESLAGAEAIGPILQGFKKPISDLSRGATVEDIVDAVVVCLVRCLKGANAP